MATRVLCLLTDGFEEIETITPVDLLRRAGAEVVLTSITGRLAVRGRCDVTMQADRLLESGAEVADFDLLLLPGGPGVKALRADGRPAQLARLFAREGKSIAAICAAPTVLADAGLLAGRRFTAHFSVHSELPGALGAERVVEDGLLLTSRGAGTALDFGLALVRRLFGEAKATEVATAIMA
jgi:4-methyl-5(b-hydroxyethyl)-thiazole monophosphate biosynthesis